MQFLSLADKTTNNGPHNLFHIRRPRIIAGLQPPRYTCPHCTTQQHNKIPPNNLNYEHTLSSFPINPDAYSLMITYPRLCAFISKGKYFILFYYFSKMLGVFSSAIVSPPDELVAAGSRTPSPKISADALVKRFVDTNLSAVSVRVGDDSQMAFTHHSESMLLPR